MDFRILLLELALLFQPLAFNFISDIFLPNVSEHTGKRDVICGLYICNFTKHRIIITSFCCDFHCVFNKSQKLKRLIVTSEVRHICASSILQTRSEQETGIKSPGQTVLFLLNNQFLVFRFLRYFVVCLMSSIVLI